MQETQIGSYVVQRLLGEGGMGTVYEGIHQQLGRRVAIKILSSSFARRPEIVARFFNEARAVNLIQHPNIVDITDMGYRADGTPYLVMRYLQGEALDARLARVGGGLGDATWHFGRQLASALAATHEKGIIHRDVKPANVIVIPDEEAVLGERAILLDFGIAKLSAQAEVKTRVGAVMGTPLYMAPEQFLNSANVDNKVDVYALGAMLFHLAVGRPPFVAEDQAALYCLHREAPPPPLAAFAPSISHVFTRLIASMLAKQPAERPAMSEVAQVLGHALRGARQPSDPRQSRRRPWLVGLVALGVGLTASGGFALGRGTSPAPARTPERRSEGPPPWELRSEPAGALITDSSRGVPLGRTPQVLERPGSGEQRLRLTLPGFLPQEVVVSGGGRWSVRLQPQPPPPPPECSSAPPESKKPRAVVTPAHEIKPYRNKKVTNDDEIPLLK
jgi:serine/threonine-protein kinase